MIAPLAAAAVLALSGAPQPRALVVTETAGFRHPSIPAARAALQRLGERSQDFDVVAVASSRSLTAVALRRARVVVFLSTTGELRMGRRGLARLLRWIRAGGGFVGLHAASNTFDREPAFARMLGARFRAQNIAVAKVLISQWCRCRETACRWRPRRPDASGRPPLPRSSPCRCRSRRAGTRRGSSP